MDIDQIAKVYAAQHKLPNRAAYYIASILSQVEESALSEKASYAARMKGVEKVIRHAERNGGVPIRALRCLDETLEALARHEFKQSTSSTETFGWNDVIDVGCWLYDLRYNRKNRWEIPTIRGNQASVAERGARHIRYMVEEMSPGQENAWRIIEEECLL